MKQHFRMSCRIRSLCFYKINQEFTMYESWNIMESCVAMGRKWSKAPFPDRPMTAMTPSFTGEVMLSPYVWWFNPIVPPFLLEKSPSPGSPRLDRSAGNRVVPGNGPVDVGANARGPVGLGSLFVANPAVLAGEHTVFFFHVWNRSFFGLAGEKSVFFYFIFFACEHPFFWHLLLIIREFLGWLLKPPLFDIDMWVRKYTTP